MEELKKLGLVKSEEDTKRESKKKDQE